MVTQLVIHLEPVLFIKVVLGKDKMHCKMI